MRGAGIVRVGEVAGSGAAATTIGAGHTRRNKRNRNRHNGWRRVMGCRGGGVVASTFLDNANARSGGHGTQRHLARASWPGSRASAVALQSASRPHAGHRRSPYHPHIGAARTRRYSYSWAAYRVVRRSRLAGESAGAGTLWAVESGSVVPQYDRWEMSVQTTRGQRRIYRYAGVFGRT